MARKRRTSERDSEKKDRKPTKQDRIEKKAKAGDAFAQSELRSQQREAVIAERIGRRRASSKFRSSSFRKRHGLKNTQEDFGGVLRQEIAKSGASGLSGLGGGQRALDAFEEKQESTSSAGKSKDVRFERAKEHKARKAEIKKRRHKSEVDQIYQGYKDNPELTERMMTEGTADLVDGFKALKKRGLKGEQFSNALESLRQTFNKSGRGRIEGLEDRNGSLVIRSNTDSQDPDNPISVTTQETESVINRATQEAMGRIGGEFRRSRFAREQEFDKSLDISGIREDVQISGEDRASERQISREDRAESRQISGEERRAGIRQSQLKESRGFDSVRERKAAIEGSERAVSTARSAEFDLRRKRVDTVIGILERKKKLSKREVKRLEDAYVAQDEFDRLARARLPR